MCSCLHLRVGLLLNQLLFLHLVSLIQLDSYIQSLSDAPDIEVFLCLLLFPDKVFVGNAEAAEEQDHTSVQVALSIGAAPDHVEREVVRGEFDLAVAKVNLAAFKRRFNHKDALSASDPNLEGTHLREPKLPSSL